jgi:hypothetical protein
MVRLYVFADELLRRMNRKTDLFHNTERERLFSRDLEKRLYEVYEIAHHACAAPDD